MIAAMVRYQQRFVLRYGQSSEGVNNAYAKLPLIGLNHRRRRIHTAGSP